MMKQPRGAAFSLPVQLSILKAEQEKQVIRGQSGELEGPSVRKPSVSKEMDTEAVELNSRRDYI